jgi:hypothetical protein
MRRRGGDRLRRYEPVADDHVLVALDRAEHHDDRNPWDEAGVYWSYFVEHLGFERSAWGTRNLRPQIRTLIDAGLVTYSRRHGRERWALTDDGRARATIARLAGTELPDSPQRRDWLACRAQAEAKIEDVRTRLGEALQDAQTLLGSGGGGSEAWYVIADRVGREAKRLGGALFCLNEWPEPDEENPDVDSQSEYNRRIDVARTRLSERSYCL